MAKAFQGYEVVISALSSGGTGILEQSNLIKAAQKAKVTRFVPSEWAWDNSILGVAKQKEQIRKQLESSGLEWTYFQVGYFLEYIWSPIFGWDVKDNKFNVTGSKDTKISFTDLETIGKYTAEFINHPSSKNNTVEFATETVTYGEAEDKVEKIIGKKINVQYTDPETIKTKLDNGGFKDATFMERLFAELKYDIGSSRVFISRPQNDTLKERPWISGYNNLNKRFDLRFIFSISRKSTTLLLQMLKTLAIQSLSPQKIPKSANQCTIASLMASDMHLGHAPKQMHPNMLPYIYGQKQTHIIHLEYSLQQLRRASNFLKELRKSSDNILWLGSKNCSITMRMARLSNTKFASYQPGMFSNPKVASYMVPDAVIIVPSFLNLYSFDRFAILKGPLKETALLELMKANIPSVSLCDSNEDIRMITYPIAGNDDGVASGQLFTKTLLSAIQKDS